MNFKGNFHVVARIRWEETHALEIPNKGAASFHLANPDTWSICLKVWVHILSAASLCHLRQP